MSDKLDHVKELIAELLAEGDLPEKVSVLNEIRETLHESSPFKDEPVDLVRWVPNADVQGNAWNPNVVAPPEMELLRLSIQADGFTQPIVANAEEDHFEVVDGFHRHRVGKEESDVRERLYGYLPVVQIRDDRLDTPDRMASTIRHNRARGKHTVVAMQDIVVELRRRNWSNEKIGRQLGMDADEVLRLCQMTGLAELFADDDFSYSWDVDDLSTSDEEALSEIQALAEGDN